MSEEILKTKNLSKKYGSNYALKDCSISIKKGQIYGLVGRNGAGKTTLMRMICGQTNPTTGTVALFGSSKQQDLVKNRTRIGCMIEVPAFYPNFSAKKNLTIYCMKKGIPVTKKNDELLKFVGLSDVGKKPFSQFSLGMKERLGIALALIGNPEFLVLDEPTNGLDPIGMAEIRELILKLNKEKNVTILLSSHILKEMSSIATHYGFIDKGQLIAELSNTELMEKCKEAICIKVNNVEMATAILEQFCGCKNYSITGKNTIKCYDNIGHPEQICRELIENGIEVFSITNEGKDLEKFFIELVKGGDTNA